MKLHDADIIALLPLFMREDDASIGLSKGLHPILQTIIQALPKLRTWDQIDHLEERELDDLAWELDIDWYDGTAPLTAKKETIKLSDLVHMRRGTRWALEQVIATNFGPALVSEWFEYEGDPYFFRVRVEPDTPLYRERLIELFRMVQETKNVRSWLEKITILTTGEMPLFFGLAANTRKRVEQGIKKYPLDGSIDLRIALHGHKRTEYTHGVKRYPMTPDVPLRIGIAGMVHRVRYDHGLPSFERTLMTDHPMPSAGVATQRAGSPERLGYRRAYERDANLPLPTGLGVSAEGSTSAKDE